MIAFVNPVPCAMWPRFEVQEPGLAVRAREVDRGPTRVTVIIVEDHPITRDGIRACVERDGRAVVVGGAGSVAGAWRPRSWRW
jgi:hypothetical protein